MLSAERKQLAADAALLLVTLIWGATFVAVQNAVSRYPVFAFLALRFGFAAAGMLLVFGRRLGKLGWRWLGAGVLIGVFLFSGYAFQTMGLRYTSASKAGFITGLQTVTVPILTALLARRRPEPRVLLAIALAFVGLALLSLRGSLKIEYGDMLILACAISFGAHITAVGLLAPRTDAMALTTVQIAFVALTSLAVTPFEALAEDTALWPIPTQVAAAAAFTGIFATCLAFGIQNGVSRYTTPTHTALVFAMEPVFAALFGYLLAGERLGPRAVFGGSLILLAMLSAEIRETRPWAIAISRFFNPLYWAGWVFLAAAWRGTADWLAALAWTAFTVLISVALPIVYLTVQLRRGVISDWHISRREERVQPALLLMAILAAIVPLLALWRLSGPRTLQAVFASGIVLVLVTIAITFFWKISQHVMGIASVATMLALLLGPFVAPFFLLVPVVAWARVAVGAHTWAQTVVGGLIGLGVPLLVFASFGLV
mgnify:CR=1 FL=1